MNDIDETTFARFAERFARIELQVPEPTPLSVPHMVGRGRGLRSLSVAAMLIGVAILVAGAIGMAVIGSQPSPRRYSLADSPDANVTCEADPGPVPSALAGDPCPAAIETVEQATRSIGVPIVQVAIRPGPFGGCGDIWSSLAPAPSCLHQGIRAVPPVPGAVMHAWVGFADTQRVLAVYLWRPLLPGTEVPLVAPAGAVYWNYTWASQGWEVPPSGWVFP